MKAIYFIGGPSAAGKTQLIQQLSERYKVPAFKLDHLYDLVQGAMNNRSASALATGSLAENVITELVKGGAVCLMEGGWLDPAKAAGIRGVHGELFSPVFCGYPGANVEERLGSIRQRAAHWICQLAPAEARTWLEKQIDGSRWYRAECEKHGIPFFDFSNFDEGSAALEKDFVRWLKGL